MVKIVILTTIIITDTSWSSMDFTEVLEILSS